MAFFEWLRGLFHSEPIECSAPIDVPTFVMSGVLTLGVLLSYLPQIVKLIKRQSSDGLSNVFLLLGALSSTSLLLNTVVLQWGVFRCCQQQTAMWCFEKSLGVTQVAIQWACFMVIVAQYLYYFPHLRRFRIHPGSARKVLTHAWRNALFAGALTVSHFGAVVAVSAVMLAVYGDPQDALATEYWADALGLLSTLLALVQFVPQIWTTWKSKDVGALSISTMLLQTPGSFFFAYTLAVRPGSNVTTWLCYVLTGTLQGFLLFLCILFHYRQRRQARTADDDSRPLLNDDGDNDSKLEIATVDDEPKSERHYDESPVSRASTSHVAAAELPLTRSPSPSCATDQSISLMSPSGFQSMRPLSALAAFRDEPPLER